MPHSLTQLHVHVVFSTKNRRPHLDASIRDDLARYINGACKKLNCHCIEVGGTEDHIHLLMTLSKNLSLAETMSKLKASTSKWIKTKGPNLHDFSWQTGYAAFSVSQSQVDAVRAYIQNQEEHHRKLSFLDELRMLLDKHGVEYYDEYLPG